MNSTTSNLGAVPENGGNSLQPSAQPVKVSPGFLLRGGVFPVGHMTPTGDFVPLLTLNFVKSTEAAALKARKWHGKGNKNAADDEATEALRAELDALEISGKIVMGEGKKDGAPGLFEGEKVGHWTPGSIPVEFVVDPIDGTDPLANGLPDSLSVICAGFPERGEQVFKFLASDYCLKLAYGPKVKGWLKQNYGQQLDLNRPIQENLDILSHALDKPVAKMTICMLNRPRHEQWIEQIRKTGASVRLIHHGDVAAAIAPALPDSDVDGYFGVGGSPEAVIAAAALKCLNGEMQLRVWPRDASEREKIVQDGFGQQLRETYFSDDVAHGDSVVFCATGISSSILLKGIEIQNDRAYTFSLLMSVRDQSVNYLKRLHFATDAPRVAELQR